MNTNLPFVNLLFGLTDLNIFLVILGLALEFCIAPPLKCWGISDFKYVNISINSLIKALSDANINIIKNEKSVDISKNVPVVLKTEIANDIEPKNNYVDTATGISPPSSDIVEDDISYSLQEQESEQQPINDEFTNVIEEALNYIKQKQSNEEPLEDEPSEPIKQPLVIEIPSPKSLEVQAQSQPESQIPPTPRAVQVQVQPQPEIQRSIERQVYYRQVLIPQPQPFPIHHYIIQPIIQPIIQYIPQPVQHFMQQFRPQPLQQNFHRYR